MKRSRVLDVGASVSYAARPAACAREGSSLHAIASGLAAAASPSLLLALRRSCRAADRQTANVVLITLDGVRIEEMFGGLDEAVARAIVKTGAAEDSPLWQRYWAPTPEERRRKLMPFLWGTLLGRARRRLRATRPPAA